ncbi:MAG TPA: hypothetical protein VIZ67_04405 [Acidimicrobiales bacterium]
MGDPDGDKNGRPRRLVIRVRLAVVPLAAIWAWNFGLLAAIAYSFGSSTGIALGSQFVAAGVVLVVRSLRSELLVDESGITIRNTWTTRSWAWDEIGEVGWDSPGWARYGAIYAISVCPLSDPYTYTASATAARLDDHRRQAACLAPFLGRHGVANAIGRETATVYNWSVDPRSRANVKRQPRRS